MCVKFELLITNLSQVIDKNVEKENKQGWLLEVLPQLFLYICKPDRCSYLKFEISITNI